MTGRSCSAAACRGLGAARRAAGWTFALAMLAPAIAAADTEPEPGSGAVDVPYRADLVPPIHEGRPEGVDLLRPAGAIPWPEPVQEELAKRVLDEWSGDRQYGSIRAGVGLWLEYPLVNMRRADRVAVPVLEATEIPVRGRVIAPAARFAGNLVILLDVSESANARTGLLVEEGGIERVPAVQAELRAARALLDHLERDRARFGIGYGPAEVGIIAFGEGTWEIVEPRTSIAEVRAGLDAGAGLDVNGSGRTDAVCALRLASDWLGGAPGELAGEIVILTDGDLPFSGRFTDCDASHFRARAERAACLATINRSPCPASHRFDRSQGRSDVAQLFSFVREMRGRTRIFPLLFHPKRAPRFFRELATHTGGEAIPVASEAEIDVALSQLLNPERDAIQVRGVYARNLSSGEESANLLDGNGADFAGTLPLVAGANDVELRIESDLGDAGLYRFRLYAAPDPVGDYLSRLEETNRELEQRLEELVDRAQRRLRRPPATRDVDIAVDAPDPPLPSTPPPEGG